MLKQVLAMLNELYELSKILQEKKIDLEKWHDDYSELPKASSAAPCYRIWLTGAQRICGIEELTDNNLVGKLRKYGSGQGHTFPAFNIVPLYRITDDQYVKRFNGILKDNSLFDFETVKSWRINNNWQDSKSIMINNCLRIQSERLRKDIGQDIVEIPIIEELE
jgi:hypothetical protein